MCAVECLHTLCKALHIVYTPAAAAAAAAAAVCVWGGGCLKQCVTKQGM